MSDWPRMMKRATAAQYCDLTVAAFEREIAGGRLPGPTMLGGKEHWCRKELDRALDHLTGAAIPDYRKQFHERIGKKAA